MKLRTVLAVTTALALCHSTFGTVLKPDRMISVTSLQHLANKTGKEYRVNAEAWVGEGKSGSQPMLFYQLLCGTEAAYLEVGQTYKAAEADEKSTKILVIFSVNPGHNSNDTGVGCDIEFVKSADDRKR